MERAEVVAAGAGAVLLRRRGVDVDVRQYKRRRGGTDGDDRERKRGDDLKGRGNQEL